MFLLVSVRHVGVHPGGHQHGVSIQNYLYKSGQDISSDISYTEYSSVLNLGDSLCIFTSIYLADSGLYVLNSFYFYFDLF